MPLYSPRMLISTDGSWNTVTVENMATTGACCTSTDGSDFLSQIKGFEIPIYGLINDIKLVVAIFPHCRYIGPSQEEIAR